jgi:hypothetical protein
MPSCCIGARSCAVPEALPVPGVQASVPGDVGDQDAPGVVIGSAYGTRTGMLTPFSSREVS